ncbi:MAG: 2Fe-2S iron-sulfur cluster-binding protein, partial [Actinomycetota bacterium]|nr:2Fe-2S iron-sulfur cluster-binding protein [Actinomycetota bacterium]
MSERVGFVCDGRDIDLDVEPGESLLVVLRERLGLISVKDGCAPQGQCGCCTVLVDGDPRVACVTPVARVAGRTVTTVDGLDPDTRDALVRGFLATGGSQCGFCTPGIVVRCAALLAKGKSDPADVDRALAAHLCRCTGWKTISEAVSLAAGAITEPGPARDLDAATARSSLEGGAPQRVDAGVPLGGGGFADDTAPAGSLVAVPLPPGASGGARTVVDAAGFTWVVADSLLDARASADKVQGRRTTIEERPPLALPDRPLGGVRLATSWVEPAYLEPDASWCEPGSEPATPLANGGAFGGKQSSFAPDAARELADRLGRSVRVVLSREDVVRHGPKRAPISAGAVCRDDAITMRGRVAAGGEAAFADAVLPPYRIPVEHRWEAVPVPGPPVGTHLRSAGAAELSVLVEGAIDEAGIDRAALIDGERAARVLLDTSASAAGGALAGARVHLDASGALTRVEVRVAAGDPLDAVVLRSYAVGATHMALGWAL